jgi:hypothetical protein
MALGFEFVLKDGKTKKLRRINMVWHLGTAKPLNAPKRLIQYVKEMD